ncbi:hypothetical protein BH09PSE6_BH09PSE6_16200 [soil metagenome]
MSAWNVTHICALAEGRLHLEFKDGSVGVVKLPDDLFSGTFGQLARPSYFAKVKLRGGVPTWPDGEQLAPDALWEDVKALGTATAGEALRD